MSYIGQRPVVGRYIKLDQISSGFNGSNTGFSMTAGSQAVFPGTARNLLLSLGGVIQEPDTDFTISGSTLTFTTPPVANTTFFGVIYGDMQATGTPSDGTVLPASIASSGNFSFPQLTVTSSASLLGGVVFNENGADVDFRVEGDTNAHLLFADASADKIGINESSPSHKLVVGGDIGVGFTTPNDAARQINFNVNRGSAGQTLANINWQWNSKFVAQIRGIAGADTTNKDDAHLAFFTSAANNLVERFRILSDGKVGIGTTSPNTKLDVRDPSGTGISSRSTATQATDTNKGLKVRNNSDTDTFSVSYKGQGYFAGNVGIGTTSPSSNLHVESSSPSVRLSDSDNSSAFCLFDGNGANLNIHADKGNNVSNSTMGFGIDNSIKMTLNSSGFLGIGTTSPTNQLHVHDGTNANDTPEVKIESFRPTIRFKDKSTSSVSSEIVGDNSLKFRVSTPVDDNTALTERMRIDSSGNVGIGTSSPSAKVEINNTGTPDSELLRLVNTQHDTNAASSAQLKFGITNSLGERNVRIEAKEAGGNFNDIHLDFYTNSASSTDGETLKMRIDASGRVMINNTFGSSAHAAADNLIIGETSGSHGMTFLTGNSTASIFYNDGSSNNGAIQYIHSTSPQAMRFNSAGQYEFDVGGTEKVRIDSSGRLMVGTTTATSNQSGRLNVFGTDGNSAYISVRRGSDNASGPRFAMCKSRNTTDGSFSGGTVQDGDILGTIHFYANDSQGFEEGAAIAAVIDGNPGSNDVPTRLTFSTTPDGSDTKQERMRIRQDGNVTIGKTSNFGNGATQGFELHGTSRYSMFVRSGNTPMYVGRNTTTGTIVSYLYNGAERGTIATDGTVIALTGTSDYRLKENNVAISDGISRLKQLKPYRFNFKETPSKTIDGFFAHEVDLVVPEAVFGDKDAVATEEDVQSGISVGDIKPQQLDQSKLVPLLTAALQEEISKREALEARVAALEAA